MMTSGRKSTMQGKRNSEPEYRLQTEIVSVLPSARTEPASRTFPRFIVAPVIDPLKLFYGAPSTLGADLAHDVHHNGGHRSLLPSRLGTQFVARGREKEVIFAEEDDRQ